MYRVKSSVYNNKGSQVRKIRLQYKFSEKKNVLAFCRGTFISGPQWLGPRGWSWPERRTAVQNLHNCFIHWRRFSLTIWRICRVELYAWQWNSFYWHGSVTAFLECLALAAAAAGRNSRVTNHNMVDTLPLFSSMMRWAPWVAVAIEVIFPSRVTRIANEGVEELSAELLMIVRRVVGLMPLVGPVSS